VWTGDAGRTEKELHQDLAQCDYDVRRTMAAMPPSAGFRSGYQAGTALGAAMQDATTAEFEHRIRQRQGESLFLSCMRARGWTTR
jgi:hypothetical protein